MVSFFAIVLSQGWFYLLLQIANGATSIFVALFATEISALTALSVVLYTKTSSPRRHVQSPSTFPSTPLNVEMCPANVCRQFLTGRYTIVPVFTAVVVAGDDTIRAQRSPATFSPS